MSEQKIEEKKSISSPRQYVVAQFIILLAGTLFAWVNFAIELVNWLNDKECSTGCSVGLTNPFLTPCFYGAVFFAIAFIFSALILKRIKK